MDSDSGPKTGPGTVAGAEAATGTAGRARILIACHAAAAAVPAGPYLLPIHVGRALALALQPLPVNVTLIDQRAPELAQAAPGIETRMSPLPEALIRAARPGSAVVILTHDHALDFLLAAEALSRDDLCYVGMIGSATKRARFSGFARKQGLDPAPLVCPIGAGLTRDKRPSVIAATTAAELIARLTATSSLNKYPCNS